MGAIYKASLFVHFIKAISSLINYDDELPCLMASCANFLRPICSYTECQLSFQTGSCPTERTTASYSSCLFLIVTDLPLLPGLFSVDASPALSVGLGADVVHSTLHLVYGFLFQNPARIQINSESRQGSGFVMLS